jgi:hypothetical protein
MGRVCGKGEMSTQGREEGRRKVERWERDVVRARRQVEVKRDDAHIVETERNVDSTMKRSDARAIIISRRLDLLRSRNVRRTEVVHVRFERFVSDDKIEEDDVESVADFGGDE